MVAVRVQYDEVCTYIHAPMPLCPCMYVWSPKQRVVDRSDAVPGLQNLPCLTNLPPCSALPPTIGHWDSQVFFTVVISYPVIGPFPPSAHVGGNTALPRLSGMGRLAYNVFFLWFQLPNFSILGHPRLTLRLLDLGTRFLRRTVLIFSTLVTDCFLHSCSPFSSKATDMAGGTGTANARRVGKYNKPTRGGD